MNTHTNTGKESTLKTILLIHLGALGSFTWRNPLWTHTHTLVEKSTPSSTCCVVLLLVLSDLCFPTLLVNKTMWKPTASNSDVFIQNMFFPWYGNSSNKQIPYKLLLLNARSILAPTPDAFQAHTKHRQLGSNCLMDPAACSYPADRNPRDFPQTAHHKWGLTYSH